MDFISQNIANNLQALRKSKQLTLQDLANITGVSKSMLGEIERGTTNPTINVLWKISTGLRVTITDLIYEHTPSIKIVNKSEWKHLQNGNIDFSLIFEYDHTRNFEVYHISFKPHTEHVSASHQRGVVEYTMVYEGSLVLTVNDKEIKLNTGDSLFFEADTPHSYLNILDAEAKAYSIIYHPNS